MKIKIKYILYCSFLVLFFLYLIFSTDIISGITNADKHVKKVNVDQYGAKDDVTYSLDSLFLYNNFMESVEIQLWAFCETQADNQSKELSILLVPDSMSKVGYKIDGIMSGRSDVYNAYKGQKSIIGINHGLKIEFSAIPIKNGTYKLCICCKENNENYGLVDTGVKLKKSGSGLVKYTEPQYKSNSINMKNDKVLNTEKANIKIDDITVGSNIKYYIDSCSIGDSLTVKGWAFISDIQSSETPIYLAVTATDGKTKVFSTNKLTRPDVAKVFKNELYTTSGFSSKISIDALSEGENKITVICESKDGKQVKAKSSYIINYESDENKF